MQTRMIAGMYKFRDWIDTSKIVIKKLSMNTHPAAIAILEQNIDKVWWPWLSANPAAMQIIKENLSSVDAHIARNPHPDAIEMIKSYIDVSPDTVSWRYLSSNASPDAVSILMKYIDQVCWIDFMKNPNITILDLANANITIEDLMYLAANPNMIDIVRENMDEFLRISSVMDKNTFWFNLSQNPAAMNILEKNIDNVYWSRLSELPEAIHLIQKKIDKYIETGEIKDHAYSYTDICIFVLSKNPAAIDILKRLAVEYDIKDYSNLSSNPAIFEYDYIGMRDARAPLHRELIAAFWSPARVAQMMEREDEFESVLASD